MFRLALFAIAFSLGIAAWTGDPFAESFTLRDWSRIENQANQKDARASGLRDGYIAGVRDALRFYSKVSKTFPICWPKDHDIDESLIRGIVDAVRREHPDIAKPDDNFAYIVVLSLYDAYPCR
ncbi:MAG: hypothetical protein GKS00_22255 [Alphaproteobacteria bacterium]|nr:hypothetical protein [Alphaproteobacteria bacterium]